MTIKVLHIISSLGRGGRERQLSIICRHSIKIENSIICFHKSESDYLKEYGIENLVYYIEQTSLWQRVRKTMELANQLGANILISWGTLESIVAMIVSIKYGIRFINFSLRHGIRKLRLSQLIRTLVLHLSKYVVANSKAGLKANNLRKGVVLYNGIERIPEVATMTIKLNNRSELIGDHKSPVFITVANLVPYKDYPTILRALDKVKESGYDFYYIIVGDGTRRKEIESLIDKYNLRENVVLTGRISNVDDYLRISDVMIHSSLGEGCSNAILEGMKHGLPIVASSVGGIPEIVSRANAMLFDYGDQDMLQRHLEILFTEPGKISSMGGESRKQLKESYSVEKMITKYECIVNSVVNDNQEEWANLSVHLGRKL